MPFQKGHKFGNRFKPGQSGNPGGKSAQAAEVEKLAQSFGTEAVLKLVTIMRKDDSSVASMAANSLLDRGFGKPTQPMEHAGDILEGLNIEQRSALETALSIAAGSLVSAKSRESPTTH